MKCVLQCCCRGSSHWYDLIFATVCTVGVVMNYIEGKSLTYSIIFCGDHFGHQVSIFENLIWYLMTGSSWMYVCCMHLCMLRQYDTYLSYVRFTKDFCHDKIIVTTMQLCILILFSTLNDCFWSVWVPIDSHVCLHLLRFLEGQFGFSAWQTRYCIIKDNIMYYFKSKTDSKQCNEINLSGYEAVSSPDIEKKHKRRQFLFVISQPGCRSFQVGICFNFVWTVGS